MLKYLVAAILGAALAAAPADARRRTEIALTFDDLPAHGPLVAGQTRLSVVQALVHALAAARVPHPYAFVNASDLAGDPDDRAAIAAWRLAGFPIGNHTWSHPDLNDVTAAAFKADIQRDEPALRHYADGDDWRWFRFPYLAEGDDAAKRLQVRSFLAAHHYKIASANIDFADYLWNEPYARCMARRDLKAVAALERSYLSAAQDALDYSRSLGRSIYRRDIPYVVLLHVGAFDARMLPRLLALYRQNGVRFVTLKHAERDPAYARDVNPRLAPEPSDLQDRAYIRGLPAPDPRSDEAALAKVCAG